MAKDIRALLDQLDRDGKWKDAPTQDNTFAPLPAGLYLMEFEAPSDGITVQENQYGTQAKMNLKVVDGPEEGLEGRYAFWQWPITNADGDVAVVFPTKGTTGLTMIKTDLKTLGVSCPKISGLGIALKKLAGTQAKVKIKHRTDGQGVIRETVQIRGLANGASEPAVEEETAAEAPKPQRRSKRAG